MADPMVRQIERACDDARRAWDAPGVMRVGSEPKVTLHESVLRRALLLLEKAERERDVWRRLAGELRIEELERELEECKHDIERHIAIVEELERERDEECESARRFSELYAEALKERDEARVLCEHYREKACSVSQWQTLPWEDGE